MTGIDVSDYAIKQSQDRALSLGLSVKFIQDDFLKTKLADTFEIIIDRGCFHVFDPPQRRLYLKSVTKLMQQGSTLLLKCFSERETYEEGPHRFSSEQIIKIFGKEFDIKSIDHSYFKGTLQFDPKALMCVLRRK